MRVALAARWSSLLGLAERRLPALTRLKGREHLPIVLHRRRIYVVPSRFGLIFSLMLLVMLLGALNYNNNPAMLLTCLLGAAAYQSVFSGFRTLNRLALHSLKAGPCGAGDTLQLYILFQSPRTARQGLRLQLESAGAAARAVEPVVFGMAADVPKSVRAELPALRRGWQPIGRIRIWTEHPFGLFHVWSWLHPDFRALVYPRAETDPPPLPRAGAQARAQVPARDDDEFGSLREYRPGDPRRMIAWKASARRDALLVKEFEQRQGSEIILDWHALEGLGHEARIARLAAWVDRAEAARVAYRLDLPQSHLGPASGAEHRHACLRELALLPEG
jgi:uncharacterized protein (DUF58 family)